MAWQQTRFLGASVKSFNCSLGWGNQVSQLRLDLVEDDVVNDVFSPPIIGAPVYFVFDTFEFGGILQSWRRIRNNTSNPTYEVIVIDPRELLDGVQLIINGYNGITGGIRNIYNIYGYLEAQGFGTSRINASGIEWYLIRDTFLTLQQSTLISFRGFEYLLDLTQLPYLPDYYRIGGESISLMDYIAEICDVASYDFFFSLHYTGLNNYIRLNTISRRNQPALGYIQNYVNSSDQIIQNNSGFELRNEVTTKFLVGGNLTDIYFQYNEEGATEEENTIWYYWGLNLNQTPIIGTGTNNDHKFTLVSKYINVNGVTDTYETDVGEIRSALADQSSWESQLWSKNDDNNSPLFGRAKAVGVISDTRIDLKTWLDGLDLETIKRLSPIDFASFDGKTIKNATDALDSKHEENITRLYNYVHNFAADYYGRRFMVRIPDVSARLDTETNQVTTSLEPTDGGFIDESTWPNAVSKNFMPEYTNFVTSEDGRIVAYAKFDNYKDLDLSDFREDDFTVSKDSVFIRCTVYPKIIFLNNTTLESPRVVIELPGVVRSKDDPNANSNLKIVGDLLNDRLTALNSADPNADVKMIFARAGGDSIMLGSAGLAKIPDMVAIPLKSNVNFYGPWYSVGAHGKVEFEKDETLVPWNYGGFTAMNLAANARVSESLTNMQVSENGNLEVPDSPSVLLGGQLIANGPYVTDINTSIGSQGVTTTYTLQTWTNRFGRLNKTFIDRMQKFSIDAQRNRRFIRELNKPKSPDQRSKVGDNRDMKRPKRKSSHSTSQVLLADFIVRDDNNFSKSNIVSAPIYNVASHLNSEFTKKAAASYDAIFAPYSTNPSLNGDGQMPHFTYPKDPNVQSYSDLSPFQAYDAEKNFNFVLRGNSVPDEGNLNDVESNVIRSIGLRLPAIGVGWGPNTYGYMMPSGGNYKVIPDHKNRQDKHMCGPIDFRWDECRSVWSPGSHLLLGQIHINIPYRGSGQVRPMSWTPSGINWNPRHIIWVKDHLLPSGSIAYAGKNCMYTYTQGDYYLIALEPNC